MLATMLARNWWSLVLRGIAGIIFGLVALIWPGLTLTVLIIWFGAYVLVDGIFAIAAGIRAVEHRTDYWVLFVEGLAGIVIGIVTFLWPGLTALAFLYLIAVWALVTGVLELGAAFHPNVSGTPRWLYGLSGVASIIFGILLVVFPGTGALTILWLIGAYAIIFGIILIALGLRLHGLREAMRSGSRL